jgi:hypothetical protein
MSAFFTPFDLDKDFQHPLIVLNHDAARAC